MSKLKRFVLRVSKVRSTTPLLIRETRITRVYLVRDPDENPVELEVTDHE